MNIAVLVSGRGTNLESILKAKQKGILNSNISLVLSDKENVRALDVAKSYGIRALALPRKNFKSKEDFEQKMLESLEKYNTHFLVLAGFMRILSDSFIKAFENKIINIHPSLLPCYKGLSTHQRVLSDGTLFSGASVHFVNSELDSGPIIIQGVVSILENDTEETLSKRVLEIEHKILVQAIKWVEENRVEIKQKRVYIKGAKYGAFPFNPALEVF